MIQNYLEKYKILFGDTLSLEKRFHKPKLISIKKGYSDVSKMDQELTLSCESCRKKSKNHKFLFGYGNKNPKLFIIIDSPSKFDLIKNKLIAGDQGKILRKALNAINIEVGTETYITSFIKYLPESNRHILISEFENCISHINSLIKNINPKVILLIGKVVSNLILNKETNIDNLRSNIFYYLGIPTIVTYHPASIIESKSLKNLFWEDIKLISSILEQSNE